MKNITRDQFMCYEEIRLSGITNMFDLNRVIKLSNQVLDREICIEIMKRYGDLKKLYIEDVIRLEGQK